jgi:hypothetical protein
MEWETSPKETYAYYKVMFPSIKGRIKLFLETFQSEEYPFNVDRDISGFNYLAPSRGLVKNFGLDGKSLDDSEKQQLNHLEQFHLLDSGKGKKRENTLTLRGTGGLSVVKKSPSYTRERSVNVMEDETLPRSKSTIAVSSSVTTGTPTAMRKQEPKPMTKTRSL